MSPLLPTAILTGPTASGKTAIALEFCDLHPEIEIVNADSLLFYRGLDIGTAKPTREEQARVPHHLIDLITPDETFTAGDFHRACLRTLEEIQTRGKRALIVGGSGFYLKALMKGLWDAPPADPGIRKDLETLSSQELYEALLIRDEPSALRIGMNDRYRLVRAHEILRQTGLTPSELETQQQKRSRERHFFLAWIDRPNEDLFQRIELRTRFMIESGILRETEWLLRDHPHSRALQSIGYVETRAFLEDQPPAGRKIRPGLQGLEDEIALSTRQLVKRQRTWLRNQFKDSSERMAQFTLERDRQELMSRLTKIYSD